MATPLASLLDAFADDKSVDVIQAGTLRTTRGTALVLASILPIFYALGAVTDIKWLTDERKFLAAIAAGFIWAIVSAADSLARGWPPRQQIRHRLRRRPSLPCLHR